jgi:hypothetical protein
MKIILEKLVIVLNAKNNIKNAKEEFSLLKITNTSKEILTIDKN